MADSGTEGALSGGELSRPPVSVIVVNFNAGALLSECVGAVLRSTVPVEVIVADNGSDDGSVELLRERVGGDRRVRILENGANLGFSRANNLALAETTGEFLLFLNPDCVIGPDTLERMLAVMADRPRVGMAGCLIRNPDGTEQAGCRRSLPTPGRALVRVLHLDRLLGPRVPLRSFVLAGGPLPAEPVEVEAISGAFMLVRREALEAVGPLDEGYFLHCEDLDWCARFRDAGWGVLFVPEVEVVHYKGGCSRDRPVRVLWHMHRGMVRFYRKFFAWRYPRPLMAIVVAAVWMRFGVLAALALVRAPWRRGVHAAGSVSGRGGGGVKGAGGCPPGDG